MVWEEVLGIILLVLAVIFGVVIGTAGGYVATAWMEINALLAEEGQASLTFAEFMSWFTLLLQDSEYIGYMVKDILLGLAFAGLGVFAMLIKTGKEVSGTKIIDLE